MVFQCKEAQIEGEEDFFRFYVFTDYLQKIVDLIVFHKLKRSCLTAIGVIK